MIRHFALGLTALVLVATAAPSRAQDAAELLVRTNRLEGQVRQLSGQIEQLQFQNRKLEERLQKFEQDVEYRFQELKGSAARPNSGATPATAAPGQRPATLPPAPQPAPQKRSDVFDPAAQPNAPGAPRTLGNLPGDPSASALGLPPGLPQSGLPQSGLSAGLPRGAMDDGSLDEDSPRGPLDLSTVNRSAGGLPPPGLPPQVLPPQQATPRPSAPLVTGTAPSVPMAGTGLARDDYDLAYGLVQQRQYDQAEMALRQFLQAYPRDRMVPDATYWLAETYYRRGRYPDAVEQYLKIYKTYGNSRLAPESLLKLSMSLRGMGQPEQACATLGEINRKYPDASGDVRASVDREARRGNC